MITVTEIAFTGYPVTDIARSRRFYEDLLGLKPTSTFAEGDDRYWVEYDLKGGTLAISNLAMEQWHPSKDGPGVALEVADFPAAINALRDAAVPFYLEPMDSPGCRMAVVADPDGNTVTIHHRRARPLPTG